MRIALYQPDIAGNVGAVLRLSACFGVPCDIIEPCGFAFSERALRRAGMDYAIKADIKRHADWNAFSNAIAPARLVLMTTKGSISLPKFSFQKEDIILMGSEGSGVPEHVHSHVTARVHIPLRPEFRSLNVAVSAGIALAEALRQTSQFPGESA